MDLSHIRHQVAMFLKWAGDNPILAILLVLVGFVLFGLCLWGVITAAVNLDRFQRRRHRRSASEKKRQSYKARTE